MIFIQRTKCPAALGDQAADGDQYNKPAVVHALWEMQHGKCCYCERKLPEKGHLKAVEHFAPKAIFKGLRNEWANLLLACSQCNGKKSDTFPVILSNQDKEDKVLYVKKVHGGDPGIIDPSLVDPEGHLDFDFNALEWTDRFAVVMSKGGSVLGTETISTVGLYDPFYAKLHRDHYFGVISVHYTNLLQALFDDNPLRIQGQRAAFETLMAPETELAGFARAFARFKRLDQKPVELKIPSGESG